MKKILLVTDGFFHPPILGRMTLHAALKALDGFTFQHTRSLENLPSNLDTYSAMVLHFHHRSLSSGALARLEQFVKRGGGLLALHAATASFKETLPYFAILGGRFIGHGAVERFTVRRVRDDLFTDIDTFTVRDELYIHELQPDIEVHFTAAHQGQDIPVVWTQHYGLGKVCYAVPGHTTASMNNPAYQQILQRALQWVAA